MKRRCILAGGLALLAALGFAVDGLWIEPNRLVVEEVHVPIVGLPAGLEGLRIVQVSDLHLSGIGGREARAAELINGLHPDLVAITGDLLQHTVRFDVQRRWAGVLRDWLMRLEAPPLGIYVSRGNSDISRYGSFTNELMAGLRQAGVEVLANQARAVLWRGAELWIAGADYPILGTGFTSDFGVARAHGDRWVEAHASTGESSLQYWDPATLEWGDYEVSGRLRRSDIGGGIGIIFYSRFPEGEDRYYYLRQYNGRPTLHLASHGSRITAGDDDTGVEPEPGRWYRFRIEVRSDAGQTRIRARVWPDGEPEPPEWQADAVDDSPERLSAGTAGLWGLDKGDKAFSDIAVRPLSAQGSARLDLDLVGTAPGKRPAGWLAAGVDPGNVAQALAGVPPEAVTLLLAHSPDQAWEVTGHARTLVLSGHTHGGQIRLPGVGALYAGIDHDRSYAAGLFKMSDGWLYVNRGVGTRVPVRFLCPPEVTLLVLERGD